AVGVALYRHIDSSRTGGWRTADILPREAGNLVAKNDIITTHQITRVERLRLERHFRAGAQDRGALFNGSIKNARLQQCGYGRTHTEPSEPGGHGCTSTLFFLPTRFSMRRTNAASSRTRMPAVRKKPEVPIIVPTVSKAR